MEIFHILAIAVGVLLGSKPSCDVYEKRGRLEWRLTNPGYLVSMVTTEHEVQHSSTRLKILRYIGVQQIQVNISSEF